MDGDGGLVHARPNERGQEMHKVARNTLVRIRRAGVVWLIGISSLELVLSAALQHGIEAARWWSERVV